MTSSGRIDLTSLERLGSRDPISAAAGFDVGEWATGPGKREKSRLVSQRMGFGECKPPAHVSVPSSFSKSEHRHRARKHLRLLDDDASSYRRASEGEGLMPKVGEGAERVDGRKGGRDVDVKAEGAEGGAEVEGDGLLGRH